MTTTVWTIGYGDRPFGVIERQLGDLGVTMIVDVRASRDDPENEDFDHRHVEEHATEAGIGYRWMGPNLGQEPADRLAAAIDDLIAIASVSRTVILCREPEPERCHRSTAISPLLRARNVTVLHVLADGTTRPHESPLPFQR